MFGEHAAESPSASHCTQKVMAAAVERQLVVARDSQDLADIEVGISFINGLIEWVSLLKADLIRGEVDGMTPRVDSRCAQPFAKVRESWATIASKLALTSGSGMKTLLNRLFPTTIGAGQSGFVGPQGTPSALALCTPSMLPSKVSPGRKRFWS